MSILRISTEDINYVVIVDDCRVGEVSFTRVYGQYEEDLCLPQEQVGPMIVRTYPQCQSISLTRF